MFLTTAYLLLTPLYPAQSPTSAPPRPLQALHARDLVPRATPAPVPVLPENLVSFESLGVRLEWRDSHWLLLGGERVLKDFGNRPVEARQAHTLIRDLRLTQLGTIGGTRPVMEYWLANGQAPQGRSWGMRTVSFTPETLKVEKVQNEWCVRDVKQVLLSFGTQEAEAHQALAVMQKYGFNQVGFVGTTTPLMTVFLRQPQTGSAVMTSRPTAMPSPARPGRTQAIPAAPFAKTKIDPATLAALPPVPAIPPLAVVAPAQQEQGGIQRASYQQSAAPAVPSAPLPINWQQTRVVQDQSDWKLLMGENLLGNFGLSEQDAHLAQAAVRHYQFTEQRRIGTGQPALGYFLCSGQPPRGLMQGLNGEAFQPDMVTMRQTGMRWVLIQGQRVVIDCGRNGEDAQALLEAIRTQRFDTVCRIGHGEGRGMYILVKCR